MTEDENLAAISAAVQAENIAWHETCQGKRNMMSDDRVKAISDLLQGEKERCAEKASLQQVVGKMPGNYNDGCKAAANAILAESGADEEKDTGVIKLDPQMIEKLLEEGRKMGDEVRRKMDHPINPDVWNIVLRGANAT